MLPRSSILKKEERISKLLSDEIPLKNRETARVFEMGKKLIMIKVFFNLLTEWVQCTLYFLSFILLGWKINKSTVKVLLLYVYVF